jgi:hypothetical protein
MIKQILAILCVCVLLAVFLSECSNGSGPVSSHIQYVVNAYTMPQSSGEAVTLGMDFDSDTVVENRLGDAIVNFSGYGINIQSLIDSRLSDGSLLQLVDTNLESIQDGSCQVSLFKGTDSDDPSDNFSGSESFTVDPATSNYTGFAGTITGSNIDSGPGDAPCIVALGGNSTVLLHLRGARLTGTISDTGIVNGRFGGGIPLSEISGTVIPALYEAVAAIVASDCPGGTCAPGSDGEALCQAFDSGSDGNVSLAEFQTNAQVLSMLAADMDLFDSSDNFNPLLGDGINDSLSCSFGFTAVRAHF